MNLKLILPLLACLFIAVVASQPSGKHLFILSGQSNMEGINPEESFTPTVAALLGEDNVIVVQDALAAQSIRRWYKDWKMNKKVSLTGADLYDRLMAKVNDEIAGEQIATVSFVWMQGERDAREKFSSLYEESLLGVYQQLLNDLKRDDINFVIGRLNDFDMENASYPDWTAIREIQVKVAENNLRFDWIDTDDLNDGKSRSGKEIINGLHMSEQGYVILGERFAQKSLQLLLKNASLSQGLKSFLEFKYLQMKKEALVHK